MGKLDRARVTNSRQRGNSNALTAEEIISSMQRFVDEINVTF